MGRSIRRIRQIDRTLDLVYNHQRDTAVLYRALQLLADGDPVNVKAAIQLAVREQEESQPCARS